MFPGLPSETCSTGAQNRPYRRWKGLGITLEVLLLGEDAADLTPEQRDLLSNWNKLTDADKKLYLALLHSLNEKKS